MAKTKSSSGAEMKPATKSRLQMAGGAAAGAMAGSVLGPIGAAVGAVVGGIAGANAKEIAASKPAQRLKSAAQKTAASALKKKPGKKASTVRPVAKSASAKKASATKKSSAKTKTPATKKAKKASPKKAGKNKLRQADPSAS